MSKQLRQPAAGDTVATIKTNMGDIKVVLFPDAAPKAVENFTTHAENGYYDGVIFHRVIPDFMIQGGDPLGKGIGGESIWGKPFKDEFSRDYHNLRGALCMANAGPNTNGSQFFILQAPSVDERFIPQMERLPDMFTDESVEDYKAVGGTPWLDFRHSVRSGVRGHGCCRCDSLGQPRRFGQAARGCCYKLRRDTDSLILLFTFKF